MKSFAAIIAALGFVASVHAETAVKTEYFHQAAADKNEGTVALDYTARTISFKAPTQDTTTNLMPLTLRYERGLTEDFAVGADIAYLLSGGSKEAGDSFDYKGMSDLDVYLRGQYGLQSNMSIHYGLNLNAALGKREVKYTGSDLTETSYQSGGMGAMAYVGMAYTMDAHIFGARLTQGFDLSKRKVEVKTTTTASYDYEGGNLSQLALFYETAMSGTIIGGELYYNGTNTTKSKLSTATTKSTTAGENHLGLKVYAAHDLNETTTLLGNIGYDMGQGLPTGTEKDNAYSIGVAGRFVF